LGEQGRNLQVEASAWLSPLQFPGFAVLWSLHSTESSMRTGLQKPTPQMVHRKNMIKHSHALLLKAPESKGILKRQAGSNPLTASATDLTMLWSRIPQAK